MLLKSIKSTNKHTHQIGNCDFVLKQNLEKVEDREVREGKTPTPKLLAFQKAEKCLTHFTYTRKSSKPET